MIGQVIQCERAGCDITFTKKTHNQRYHDGECCRLATNAKIMENYYKTRARRLNLARYCASCNTKLSRYNPADVCNACTLDSTANRNSNVAHMLSSLAA